MADATLYIFDGNNLLHAGPFAERASLADRLASFVAEKGARGIVVFDGAGTAAELGPLSVRFAPDADTLIERLAVQQRRRERVVVVSSDLTLLGTVGPEVARFSARTFFRDLESSPQRAAPVGGLADKLGEATRARLERLRRGE